MSSRLMIEVFNQSRTLFKMMFLKDDYNIAYQTKLSLIKISYYDRYFTSKI